ncbi:MAG: type II restriction endonuclease [Candidatus Muirbacterium halophilum]|nr:type II restriction endonuclease [Candidatus Muirbacterium halophilum]
MDYKQKVGSYTAKGGFKNEADICLKFNNYKIDEQAQKWLNIMGYDYKKIKILKATQISSRINKKTALDLGVTPDNIEETIVFKKADIQIKLDIVIDEIYYIENISLKKANVNAGYNQVDKRPVDKYKLFWDIPLSICETLKYYTGEIKAVDTKRLKDKRRMFLNEMDKAKVNELINFFKENKTIIFNDVLRGRGALSADWFLVTRKDDDRVDWILKDINFVCNFFAKGSVEVTKRGNLKIGKMSMQRKGGTPDPESLQFKINPLNLFNDSL